jgi:hypothetical protein
MIYLTEYRATNTKIRAHSKITYHGSTKLTTKFCAGSFYVPVVWIPGRLFPCPFSLTTRSVLLEDCLARVIEYGSEKLSYIRSGSTFLIIFEHMHIYTR